MRQRPSSRLLVLDAEDRLLLFRFEHKEGALAGIVFWATPGGAVDPGESFAAAACRELYEETGLAIADPGPEIAHRETVFTLPDGETVLADERYFLIRADGLTPSTANWTALEQAVMGAHHWWSQAELVKTDAQIWPENLATMLAAAGLWVAVDP